MRGPSSQWFLSLAHSSSISVVEAFRTEIPVGQASLERTRAHERMRAMAERAQARVAASADDPDSPEQIAEQTAVTRALSASEEEAIWDLGQLLVPASRSSDATSRSSSWSSATSSPSSRWWPGE